MADELSDEAWADICVAAERPHAAEARAVLSTILFEEYPRLARDPKRWRARRKQAEQALKHLAAFAELFRQEWLPHISVDQFQAILAGPASALTAAGLDVNTEGHLWFIKKLRKRTELVWCGAQAFLWANARRRNSQREWLYHELYSVWLDHFHAPDFGGWSVPSKGGPPAGPLIAFMLTAMGQVMKLPKPEAVRRAIVRVRKRREAAPEFGRALAEFLRGRS